MHVYTQTRSCSPDSRCSCLRQNHLVVFPQNKPSADQVMSFSSLELHHKRETKENYHSCFLICKESFTSCKEILNTKECFPRAPPCPQAKATSQPGSTLSQGPPLTQTNSCPALFSPHAVGFLQSNVFFRRSIEIRERCNYEHTELYFETLLSLTQSGTILKCAQLKLKFANWYRFVLINHKVNFTLDSIKFFTFYVLEMIRQDLIISDLASHWILLF